MSMFLSMTDSTMAIDSKHYNMMQFNNAVRDYIKTRADESASLVNRHLNILSATMEYSVFDPNTSIVCEFYVSLHELLNCLEPRSTMGWCCVNVLGNACHNPAARNSLIHTYQFIPPLSRLIGDHLCDDKKVQLLTVMQELSCGLKISWQIPNLSHLMGTLIRWIEMDNKRLQIVVLSLGVLVNLCYKNLPAVYTLSRCVDIKNFIRMCSKLKGAKVEVSVCKLLIILDHLQGDVPEGTFLKLIGITFISVKEALQAKDPILLRHTIEFYLDIKHQNEKRDVINHLRMMEKFERYLQEVEEILQLVETEKDGMTPECMVMVFKFLHSLVVMKLEKLVDLYPKIVDIALHWIQTELACTEALGILCTIALDSGGEKHDGLLDPLLRAMPIFLAGIEEMGEDINMNIEHCKQMSSVMKLLRVLLKSETTRHNVLSVIEKKEEICKVFIPLLGNNSPRSSVGNANNYSPDAISFYVNTLVLIKELANYSSEWVNPLSTLLQHRQIHAIMAEALYGSDVEVKSLILSMAVYPLFPCSALAKAMHDLHPMLKSQTCNSNATTNLQESMICYPMTSVVQSQKLDETIDMLKAACSSNRLVNISTSDVMELYEYRLASMGHAERAAIASVEAASQHCTHLQHQLAQLKAEFSRTRQLFLHAQQHSEELDEAKKTIAENNKQLSNHLDAEKGRNKMLQTHISQKEKAIVERDERIDEMARKLRDRDCQITELEKLKTTINKLQESLLKQEKNSVKKDDLLKTANSNIEHYKAQMVQFERHTKQLDLEIKKRDAEIAELEKLKGVISVLEETIDREVKNSEKKDKLIMETNNNVEQYKAQLEQFENQTKRLKCDIKNKSDELTQVKEELEEKTGLINTITKLTMKKK